MSTSKNEKGIIRALRRTTGNEATQQGIKDRQDLFAGIQVFAEAIRLRRG
jgi:hypothetical protein